jgi:hypothetical protein
MSRIGTGDLRPETVFGDAYRECRFDRALTDTGSSACGRTVSGLVGTDEVGKLSCAAVVGVWATAPDESSMIELRPASTRMKSGLQLNPEQDTRDCGNLSPKP